MRKRMIVVEEHLIRRHHVMVSAEDDATIVNVVTKFNKENTPLETAIRELTEAEGFEVGAIWGYAPKKETVTMYNPVFVQKEIEKLEGEVIENAKQ